MERIPVVIVGAGQAGLSVSYGLSGAGVEHVLLERARTDESWRRRWDSFCLVTPNWTVQLPGGRYEGDDPNGFMPRDEIVGHLEAYAGRIRAPVHSGVDVSSMDLSPGGGFRLRTSAGEILAGAVVAATGAFQKPHRPPGADMLPPDLLAIDTEDYTNPGDLQRGTVLVVGSGQTGCQIAEELHAEGREVTVSCGRAPWAPRRIEGRDIVSWLLPTPFMDQTIADLPSPEARLGANPQFTGRDGGHDLNYRTLSSAGVTLAGHFLGAEDHSARFAPDLAETVAFGDARYGDVRNLIRKSCIERGEPVPEFPLPAPFTAQSPDRMDLRDCAAVIFACGYRPDYRRWIQFPDAFDDLGFPTTCDGASTAVPGLYFIGTHFLRKRKSSLLFGVGEDAGIVADDVVKYLS